MSLLGSIRVLSEVYRVELQHDDGGVTANSSVDRVLENAKPLYS